jgi:hypothetical protein
MKAHSRVFSDRPETTFGKQVYFARLEELEGTVLEVRDNLFLARLVDPTGAQPDQEVELELAQITDADQPLVMPGAMFYWTIGYRTHFRRDLVLALELRRLPPASQHERRSALREAEQFKQRMGWN